MQHQMSVETGSLNPRPFPDVASVKDNSSCRLEKRSEFYKHPAVWRSTPAPVQYPAMANDVTVGNPGPNTTCY